MALLVDATIIRVLLCRSACRRTMVGAAAAARLYARYGISDEIQPERAGVPVDRTLTAGRAVALATACPGFSGWVQ